MHIKMVPALALAAVVLAGCGGDPAPDATTAAPPATTASPSPTAAPGTPGVFVAGEATVETTGDVEQSFTASFDAEDATYDAAENGYDFLWQNDEGLALRITVDLVEGEDTSPFVAIGLPGTSLFDENYFPDQFNSQCEVQVDTATDTEFAGSFSCDELERGDGEQTIDATGTFSASA